MRSGLLIIRSSSVADVGLDSKLPHPVSHLCDSEPGHQISEFQAKYD